MSWEVITFKNKLKKANEIIRKLYFCEELDELEKKYCEDLFDEI